MKGLDKMKRNWTRIIPRATEEIRWALMYYDRSVNFCVLCGKYAFPFAASIDPKTKTFTTRKEAREVTRYRGRNAHFRVIKVRVTVTPIVE